MKKIILILTLYVFGLADVYSQDFKKSIDSLLSNFQKNNAFSGNILLQKDGETIYKGDFNSFKNNNNNYRVGSITKIFTSIIIFQLIEEGKLSLNDKLNKYYPNIKNAEDITIANLLNHTSGIYNYLEWNDYYKSKEQEFSKLLMLEIVTSGKPDFKPGKDVRYSNSNYLLLGYIIEDITQKSYLENINNRIINKISLANTYYETNLNEYSKRNSSYYFDGEKWFKENDTHPSFTSSAGAVVSNTEDLSKLMNALFNGELITKESLIQMGTINKTGIGYGLFYTPFYDLVGFGHSGHIDEFYSFTSHFPKEKITISILSNGGRIKLNEVVIAVMSKLYNKPYNSPNFKTFISNIPNSSKKFIGIYKAKLIGVINVGTFQISEAANDHLFLSMYDDGIIDEKVLMERTGENKYHAKKNNADFEFELDKKGNVTGLKLSQNKQSIYCKKIK